MKILACAVGFGLGPNGKLCSIVNSNKQYEWYACGDKLNLSIYKKNPFLDTCWSKNKEVLLTFLKKYNIKLAVDVLDPEIAIFLKNIGIKVIYIDSLPFMWTKADLIPYEVDYYCAQKYPFYTINKVLKPIKNLVWIDPITSENLKGQAKNNIVINFGGLHSPFGEGKEYFELVMEALLSILPNKEICVTGGENVVKLTNKLFPELFCATYSHENFLDLVSKSKLFITSPGLTTIYETCEMNIKTIFLPPQNLSQFYNLSIGEIVCKNVKILDWNCKKLSNEYFIKFKNKPEKETVKYIYKQINVLSKDEAYILKFKKYVSDKFKDKFKVNKTKYFKNNGIKKISEILNKIEE